MATDYNRLDTSANVHTAESAEGIRSEEMLQHLLGPDPLGRLCCMDVGACIESVVVCCHAFLAFRWPTLLRKRILSLDAQTLLENLLTQFENTFDELLRAWRAAGNIDIDGNDSIHALYGVVTIEKLAAGIGALAHAQHPLGIRHLLPQQTQARPHLHADGPCHNHQIRLARARTEDLRTKSRQIILGSRGRGHHFDGAAGQPVAERPDRT